VARVEQRRERVGKNDDAREGCVHEEGEDEVQAVKPLTGALTVRDRTRPCTSGPVWSLPFWKSK
jgi:hypothetical protein